MRLVIILSCVFGVVLCVPVVTRDTQPNVGVPSPVQVGASDQVEAARKRRHLFGLDIDIYNNNGFGYFGRPYHNGSSKIKFTEMKSF